MRTLLPILCLLLTACTAELKEQNNALQEQVQLLQRELETSETARGAVSLELRDLSVRHTRLEAAAKYGFDLEETLWAVLDTSMGEITCRLFPAEAPQTVRNFIQLTQGEKEWFDPRTKTWHTAPFYEGTVIHRVVRDVLIQAGTRTGGAGYQVGFKFDDEIHPDLPMVTGALAMANAGPNTNGSQFFIVAQDRPSLTGKHTVFGACEPLDVILDISRVPTLDPNDPANDTPADPPGLERVTIHRGARPGPAAK